MSRWEWRTFGRSFGAADAAFAALEPTGVQESDELYLLATDGDTVKVRDDLMDIKVLREVNDDGLERWEPVLKASFPMSAEDVAIVLASLRIRSAAAIPDRTTFERFLAEVVALPATVRPVRVHKRRVRYVIGGCTAEVTDVLADDMPTRTIAIESEDPAAVVAAVRTVGLEDYVNTSYPHGLAALLDGRRPRFAVIDVGTNSVKFHVAERDADGEWRTVIDRAEVTRLGEGIGERGEIAPAARDRTVTAIGGMADEARGAGAVAIALVGTAGLRAARNRGEVLEAIQARTGLRLTVISGDEEGRLAYLATKARLGLDSRSVVIFDTGGGSSQFTFGQGDRIDERFSLPVGAVRYTERFGLGEVVTPSDLEAARAAIAADLSSLDGRPRVDLLIAMGGAVTNITAVKHQLAVYDPEAVCRTVLDAAEIERQIELYRSRDAAARRQIVGLQPKRADVILAGACIVRAIMEKLNHETLIVSDRGLRHGVLARFG